MDDSDQGDNDSSNFLGFGKILYSLLIVEQPFSLPKLSASEGNEYANPVEQGSSSIAKPPDILRALLPLSGHCSKY